MSGHNPQQAMQRAVDAAKEGGDKTKKMRAGAGRAAYVPAGALEGVADPGAIAVGIWLQAVQSAVFGN